MLIFKKVSSENERVAEKNKFEREHPANYKLHDKMLSAEYSLDEVKKLLSEADINLRNWQDDTLLEHAALWGNINTIKLILAHPNLNIKLHYKALQKAVPFYLTI